jgi:hypothetical protein
MLLPFSVLALAYFIGCFGVACYVAYSQIRCQRLSNRAAICASITLLPLCLMIVAGLAADDIDVNPQIESSHQLAGAYSFGSQSLTLKSDGTFTSTGLFSDPSGTWTLGSFTLSLSGTAISPRVVTCNGDICIAPYYHDVDGPIGLLLRRHSVTPSDEP